MKKIIFGMLLVGAFFTACKSDGKKVETSDAKAVTEAVAADVFANVAEGSHVQWRAAHLGGIEPRFGTIGLKSAKVAVVDGVVTNAKAVIDMSALSVDNFQNEESKAKLTGHLLNADFFNVEKYPISEFELSSIEATEGEYNALVTGNLTILGVAKSITMKANVNVGDTSVSIKSEDFVVNRLDWGLEYNKEGTAGVPLKYIVANDVGFTIDVTVAK